MAMDCTETRNYLHAHLDRELDPVTSAGIEAHLKSCAACTQAYAVQTSLKSALRKNAGYHAAPAALAARIGKQFHAAAPVAGKTAPRRPWLPLFAAVAATAVVTWTTVLQLETGTRGERIAEQVIAGHARSMLTTHLADVASSDQHTVKPWLSSKLDFSPPVTDLTAAGFPLAGARLDYIDHRPVAALVYRHRQHVINLFVWPDEQARAGATMQPSSKQGYNLLHWDGAGMTFWAISDLNQADIKTFAETYASAK
jgi:mycothiol system anti-sigma-R factor